jgi:hypothetical protein
MTMAHPTSNFLIPDHDFQAHSGADANHGPLTVEYKRGGPTGELLATETITYDSDNNIATRHIVWEV